MRTGDAIPPPAYPHDRHARRIDAVLVIPQGHERQPSLEQPAQIRHARCRLELDPREPLDPEQLRGRVGLGQYHLGIGSEYPEGEGWDESRLVLVPLRRRRPAAAAAGVVAVVVVVVVAVAVARIVDHVRAIQVLPPIVVIGGVRGIVPSPPDTDAILVP